MEDIIKTFLNQTIKDMNSQEFNLPYIKFVFADEALDIFSKYNKETTNYLRNVKKEYETNIKNNEDIYIKVDDYKKFFFLLNEIIMAYCNTEYRQLRDPSNYIRSIWLRMSPGDINDVNNFLKNQLIFLKTNKVIPYYPVLYGLYEDKYPIYYQNKTNEDWFETNNRITFSFERDDDKKDSIIPIKRYYYLPSIHYALTKENNNRVCYIYGIQNIEKEKDPILKEKLEPTKDKLLNAYVSPDFVLALKLFIDLLDDKKIYTIKIPLLQVYNYSYHKHLSRKIKKNYDAYEDKEELEKKLQEGSRDNMVLFYEHTKKMYDKFVDKEELISKNKTERLVETFMVLNEKYNNIEFLNEPFIESDYLIVKIKKNKKIK